MGLDKNLDVSTSSSSHLDRIPEDIPVVSPLDVTISHLGEDALGVGSREVSAPHFIEATRTSKNRAPEGLRNLFATTAQLFAGTITKSPLAEPSVEAPAIASSHRDELPLEKLSPIAAHFAVGEGREKLERYLEALGTSVTFNEAIRFMDRGEKIGQQVALGNFVKHGDGHAPLPGQLPLPSDDDVRALSWFIMGKVGVTGNFIKSGTLRFPDRNKKVFDYLNGSPHKYTRVSTHYNSQSLGPARLQSGIEDYDRKMPSNGGCILYNALRDGTTFIKFELAGLPKVFTPIGSSRWEKFLNFFRAIGRCIKHCTSFLETRGHQGHTGEYTHKEHIPSDILKPLRAGLKLLSQAKCITSDKDRLAKFQAKLADTNIIDRLEIGKELNLEIVAKRVSKLGLNSVQKFAELLKIQLNAIRTLPDNDTDEEWREVDGSDISADDLILMENSTADAIKHTEGAFQEIDSLLKKIDELKKKDAAVGPTRWGAERIVDLGMDSSMDASRRDDSVSGAALAGTAVAGTAQSAGEES